MRVVYIISAYKYPEQLVRLIKRLHSNHASIYVHVDKKTNPVIYKQMVQGTQHLPDVTFLQRYRCDWGSFGHVQATLAGIQAVIERKIDFDYVILLTGQDYPIKSEAQIMEFLSEHQGQSFINSFPLPSENWEYGGMQRIEYWHMRIFNRHIVLPKCDAPLVKRKFPQGLQPFGGSSYWCLSQDCIKYIQRFVQGHPGFVRFFHFVDVPDEIFFQTILMNSPYAETIVNDDLRFIEWKDPDAGSPSILETCDFEKMIRSDKLFARKFDMQVDAEVLDYLDQAAIMEALEK